MKPIVIKVNQISKKYRIGQAITGDLRQTLVGAFQKIFTSKQKENTEKEFWAIKNISFDVHQGEVLGIIGSNGAGKSTLLKILSRITYPTSGSIEIKGRVVSLLEVGTGFHPELSGRENIYLNGSLLGMKKKEISSKMDEIIDFSGVDQFIDTPVKHYSSGMYIRLAFAVAAHLEPEILLIDEVLAVGDIAFQNKCLGKMDDIAKRGRTVIFVSIYQGTIHDAVSNYLASVYQRVKEPIKNRLDRGGNGAFRFVDAYVTDEKNNKIDKASSGKKIKIHLPYESMNNTLLNVIVRLEVKDISGNYIFICNNRISEEVFANVQGNGIFICLISKLPLSIGDYYIDLFGKVDNKYSDILLGGLKLSVIAGSFYKTGLQPSKNKGILVDYNWQVYNNSSVKS